MKFELKLNQPFTKHRPDIKKNQFVFYFDEDLLNDSKYSYNEDKYVALKFLCEKAIAENAEYFYATNVGMKNDGSDLVIPCEIVFNLDNVPAVINEDECNTGSALELFRETSSFATEMAMDTKLEKNRRKSHRAAGGPTITIDMRKTHPSVIENLSSGCLGCMGFDPLLPDDFDGQMEDD